jgi:hypothetical protein
VDFIPEAFLEHAGACYVPGNTQNLGPGETAVTRLIEGVCAQFPKQSFAILRERIFSRQPLTPACEGMIRVVAKRASFLPEIEYVEAFLNASADGSRIEVSPNEPLLFDIPNAPKFFGAEKEVAEFAITLRSQSFQGDIRKPVACVLISSSNEVLAYAWNTNEKNRAQHAELNLIRSLKTHGLHKIPASATLIVTLKPCAMCAAQIFTAAAENSSTLKIIYLEDDLGPMAQNSVLVKGSTLWTKAGEPDIRLAPFLI